MSSYAPDEKWEKASKDTKLLPNEYIWVPTEPGAIHSTTLSCSGNLMRTVEKIDGKSREHYWCEECGYTYDL